MKRCLLALVAMVCLLLALPLHADTLNLTVDASATGGVICRDCGPFGAITGNFEVAKAETPEALLAATPVPAAMMLFGTGMLGFAGLMRKRLRRYV